MEEGPGLHDLEGWGVWYKHLVLNDACDSYLLIALWLSEFPFFPIHPLYLSVTEVPSEYLLDFPGMPGQVPN